MRFKVLFTIFTNYVLSGNEYTWSIPDKFNRRELVAPQLRAEKDKYVCPLGRTVIRVGYNANDLKYMNVELYEQSDRLILSYNLYSLESGDPYEYSLRTFSQPFFKSEDNPNIFVTKDAFIELVYETIRLIGVIINFRVNSDVVSMNYYNIKVGGKLIDGVLANPVINGRKITEGKIDLNHLIFTVGITPTVVERSQNISVLLRLDQCPRVDRMIQSFNDNLMRRVFKRWSNKS